jgi:putative phosphoesterase
MRIGILSDSHGKTRKLRVALEVLVSRGVEAIVHCGDICCTRSLHLLASTGIPAWLVAGNMDRHLHHQLEKMSEGAGVTFWYSSVEVPIENDEYLIAVHGDNEGLLEELIRGQRFPYVCHGHTHRARDIRIGDVRVICPGAIAGPRHLPVATIAILDTVTDALDFYDIAQPDQPIHIAD